MMHSMAVSQLFTIMKLTSVIWNIFPSVNQVTKIDRAVACITL